MIKADLAHRPWPVPQSSWVMKQCWHDLLFMHWPLPVEVLAPFIPKGLSLDTFNGTAWIGIVPFRMSDIHLKFCPPIPGTSAFPELNVRTYVTDGKKPGVWFFSLDAANLLAVKIARSWYHLPYFHADMSISEVEKNFHYKSQRRVQGTLKPEFSAEYRPVGESYLAQKGSFDYWLTERYCLYAAELGNLYRGEIHHAPWQLQPAQAKIFKNTLTPFLSTPLPNTEPLLHFSRFQEVILWGLQKLE
jgi:uncharacterized protein YqjF (DUF2071 family)